MHFLKKETLLYIDQRERLKGGTQWKFTVLRRENPSWISLEFIANVQRSNTLLFFVTLALLNLSIRILGCFLLDFKFRLSIFLSDLSIAHLSFAITFHILKVQVSKWLTFKLENNWNRSFFPKLFNYLLKQKYVLNSPAFKKAFKFFADKIVIN